MMPQYGLAVMSFDNRTYGGTSYFNIGVLDTILVMTGLERMDLPPSEILRKRQDQLAAIVPTWEGAEVSGLFAENFFLDNRIRDLKKRSHDLFEQAGKIMNIKKIVPENQLRGTFVMEGEKMNIRVFFTLTPEKEPMIQQVRIRVVGKQNPND
jgi:hypothetical protein